ncbi:hypothetical protein O181_045566 [Austropuccinia psidii MF-1]|uniref:Uncharacterized protein n=1 Tax=Austropuccinia psidii MF-1 TaxID=1389203 RepID=A0A9Q3DSJ7_9BASI|nr:hypothetical protein [Austropuccinia psidii MF-1]
MPSTRSGARLNTSSSFQKGYRRDYGRSQSVTEEQELTLPQEASVNIYKASQKAYINALQNKEYQILAGLWKNCMNSYLTVRKFLGHPNTCKLLNGWHPLMEKKNHDYFNSRMQENSPPPPKQVLKAAPVAIIRNSNIKQ